MASWKKVVVSGSQAELNTLTVDSSVAAATITNASSVSATRLTGSFSGSFVGDGNNLDLSSNPTVPASGTNIKDIYFVTPNGTDATGRRGNLNKPYKN